MALLFALIFCGCATSPTPRLYLLRPELQGPAVQAATNVPLVLMRPVEIAEYIDRPQIVIRRSKLEVALSQFDRWAEPLDNQINLYITETLADELKDCRVKAFPCHDQETPLYEVELSILSLDGTPGEKVSLTADWKIRVTGKEPRILKDERISIQATCPEPGIPGVVSATEKLLSDLSDTIATALKECL